MPAFRPTLAYLAGALAALFAASPAHAWSGLGHRMVGELAARHVQPATRAEIDKLLAGEPDPTLGGVATWADDLRNTDPDRFKATSRWHYVNTTDGTCHFVMARDCPDGQCVVGAIEAQRKLLADRSQPLAVRRDALKFLVHFVGDVHQPMHASNHPDKGGNDYQISLRTKLEPEAYARSKYIDGVMGTNLHSIWDYYILGEVGVDKPGHPGLGMKGYADRLDALPWPPEAGALSAPLAWASESCRLVDARSLYPQGHVMDRSYLDAMRPLAEQRVRQAAWRLAKLLDDTLGTPTP
ncbi:S1/P1 nuclease [Lysobacter sp. KIS68-7]|uniref:S1/P1 nuclease n=1 Tax=Lysobacter sp. KIS68-7 TaxID=2904252 RepID=UPI001E385533|nr:S1/P1 nuclease [Lysobacter sp. KIS68-7]UHQ20881.1 S1/P1 nuclease [Lysobacter sp. KIS68-7]